MDDEKSEESESNVDSLQSEDSVPELQDSPDPQFGGERLGMVEEGDDPEPEQGSPVAFQASSKCSDCPEEMAEEVYLGRVHAEDAILFRAHLQTCPHCRQVYDETVQFVDAIRAAADTLESVDGATVN